MVEHATRRHGIAVVVGLLLLASCTPLPTRALRASADERTEAALHPLPPTSTTGFAPANATPEQRAATVGLVWKTIADLFYDPKYNGVDIEALRTRTLKEVETVTSDADFYRVLKRNVRALHDSHTGIEDPRESQNFRTGRATQIGIGFTAVDGRVVVTRVVPDFPAERAGVQSGMIVEQVDDTPIDEALYEKSRAAPATPAATPGTTDATESTVTSPADAERAVRVRSVARLLAASPTGAIRPHRIVFRRADDSLLTVDVEARAGEVPTREAYLLLPSGIGILQLTAFNPTMRGRLAIDIEKARTESRGLILDLRGNPGGEVELFRWLVGEFTATHALLAETLSRNGGDRPIESTPAKHPYLKPLAILTDRGTASAAELTSHALVEVRDAITVGEPTCGCVVGVAYDYVLPDGGVLRVAQLGFRSARGRKMEGDPLLPSIPTTPTLKQLRLRDDVAIDAAEKALLAHS